MGDCGALQYMLVGPLRGNGLLNREASAPFISAACYCCQDGEAASSCKACVTSVPELFMLSILALVESS